MAYNYVAGDGKTVLLSTEPNNADSVASSCTQAIRQIKAWIRDATTAGAATKAEAQAMADAAQAAAIAAAAAAAVAGKNIFRAKPTADIDIVHGGAGSSLDDVSFGTEEFDPDGDFGSNVFTAPANGYYRFEACLQLSVSAGAPTSVDFWGLIVSSGGTASPMSGRDGTGTAQSFSTGGCTLFLTAGDTVKVQVSSIVDAACTVRVNSNGSYFSGFRVR